MRISFIIPSRNNLKYLKYSVASVLEYYGSNHDIILLDDASTDGTWEWIQSLKGDHFIKYRNDGPERVGHIPLYNLGVKLCKTDVFSVFHADMIITENYIPNMLKHLKRRVAVSGTRIEPPLHPPGPEKHVQMFGFEPEEFKKEEFLKFVAEKESEYKDQITNGMFVPWMMYKEDYIDVGGFDTLFAPMELDDSDLANRLYLNKCDLIQSRDAYVYHMTCRGSRFKDGIVIEKEIPLPDGTIWYKPRDSEEYKALRAIKFREWWRKWKTNVLHDDLMMPIVSNRYIVCFNLRRANKEFLRILEPWADFIITDNGSDYVSEYIEEEKNNTMFDLYSKFELPILSNNNCNVEIEIDHKTFNDDDFKTIQHLQFILETIKEPGKYNMGNLTFNINHIKPVDNSERIKPMFKNIF